MNEIPLLGLKLFFQNVHFFIDDLNHMTLLGNVHVLCIIASEFILILLIILFRDFKNCTKVLTPYETCKLQIKVMRY
jgi:hypothetical protein